MTKANAQLWEFAVEHFALPRMNSYLQTSLGNYEEAVELYRWNSEFASALWEAIASVEVALRNLLDQKMTQHQHVLHRDTHWIFDAQCELGRQRIAGEALSQPFKEKADAMRRVNKNRKPLTPDQIISELSFGFWHQLISKRQLFLWPELASGFSNAPSRDQGYISNLTKEVRDLRNRIGHHHPLSNQSIKFGQQYIMQLANSIDQELVNWIKTGSRINQLIENYPMKSHLLP